MTAHATLTDDAARALHLDGTTLSLRLVATAARSASHDTVASTDEARGAALDGSVVNDGLHRGGADDSTHRKPLARSAEMNQRTDDGNRPRKGACLCN